MKNSYLKLFICLFGLLSQKLYALEVYAGRLVQVESLENFDTHLEKGLLIGIKKKWTNEYFGSLEGSYLSEENIGSHLIQVGRKSTAVHLTLGKSFFKKIKVNLGIGLGLLLQHSDLLFLSRDYQTNQFSTLLSFVYGLEYFLNSNISFSLRCRSGAKVSELRHKAKAFSEKLNHNFSFSMGYTI